MIDSGTMVMLITALSAGICALCLFSVYGNVIRHETTLHDLRNRVETLQNKQTLHIAELKGEIPPDPMGDVEILPDEPDELSDSDSSDVIIEVGEFEDQESAEPVSSSTNAA